MVIDLKQKLRYTLGYFVIMLIFWVVSLVLWLSWGYYESFTILNQYHWDIHDSASLYFFTHLADGVILPSILLLWIWRRDPALALTAVIAIFATGILTQTGKLTFFDDWHRPPAIFENMTGVDIFAPHPPKRHSFPSGHATSFAAGGLFFAYSLSTWKKWMGLVVGAFTIFLCYTRVTIGVHFPADIFIGSMIGSIGAFLLLVFLYPRMAKTRHEGNIHKWDKATRYVMIVAVVGLVAQFINLISRI